MSILSSESIDIGPGDSNALYMYLMLEIMAASLAALLMKNRKDAVKAGTEK